MQCRQKLIRSRVGNYCDEPKLFVKVPDTTDAEDFDLDINQT